MVHDEVILPTESKGDLPVIRAIGVPDLRDALAKGIDDFWAMPTHVIFLCVIYPIVGLLLARAASGLNLLPLLYPLASGFALVGPFAAIGLYELSRRRELGLDTSWKHAFDVVHSPSIGSILTLGLLLVVIFAVWIGIAHALYVSIFGEAEPKSLTAFLTSVLATPEGSKLILIGNFIGFLFAVLAFVLSVVSFPLLLDRNVGTVVAVTTSAKAVLKNPITMALWALIVVGGLVLGSLPLLIGLAIVMPILGHATWHLYRKVVEPDRNPRPEYRPKPKAVRYGAQFPASLFAPYRQKTSGDES